MNYPRSYKQLQKWKNYMEENEILVDFEDFQLETLDEGKKRKLEPATKKALQYGGAAFFGLAAAPAIPVVGGIAGAGTALGLLAMWTYREITDDCSQKCGKDENPKKCKYLCYANACQETIDRLKKVGKKKMKDLENEEQKEKASEKLEKKIEKYKKKKKNYEEKARKASGYQHGK